MNMQTDDNGGDISSTSHHANEEFVFNVGMLFYSENEAYNRYNLYAVRKGFGVRKGKKYYNKNGDLTGQHLNCSCEGTSSVLGSNEERKRERLEYRCGCKARITFKVTNGTWEVTSFNDEHNHPMIEESQKHFISSARKMKESSKRILGSMVDAAAIKAKKAFRYTVNESGGSQNVGFTEQDCHNFVQENRRSLFSGGDAQSVLNHFKRMQAEDPSFFYAIQTDDDGRLMNFFWRDGMSRLHYEAFGDVLIFDTTYRTNRYNMICAPFVGINNHWNNAFFGCAFLSDETQHSFIWLFETFLESMGGKAPKTIFTDQAPSIATSIEEIFKSTCHRLCEWHIERNAMKNISHLMGNQDFKDKYLNKLMWKVNSPSEFEVLWNEMIKKFDLGENRWLNTLYGLREKWSPAFNHGYFSAGSKSTQRSESSNFVFNQMTSTKTMTLFEFVSHYEQKAGEMRDIELQNDFKSRGKPKPLIPKCGILKHASEVYTATMFSEFQREFLHGMSEKIVDKVTDGSSHSFTMQSGDVMQFDLEDSSISCSCHKFETMGLLCCHALRVMHIDLDLTLIPSQYILKRWTKFAKQGLGFENYANQKNNVFSSPTTMRLNALLRRSFAVMSTAATDENMSKMAHHVLDNTELQLSRYQNDLTKDGDNDDEDGDDLTCDTTIPESLLLDPSTRWPRGKKNIRCQSQLEKKRKKPSKNKNASQSRLDAKEPGSYSQQEQQTMEASFQDHTIFGTLDDRSTNYFPLETEMVMLQDSNMSFTKSLEQVHPKI